MPPLLFSLPVLLLHSQNCINIHVQLCIITDHGQHWDGVQRDGPWLQASHSQSQKNGSGCSCTLKSELLRSFAQCRTTTLCIMRRSPRRSWCTEWLSLCKSTPSQAGYEILTMFWLRYYHRITFFYSTFVTIITRWGLSECLSWFAAGMSPESHCFSRLNWKSDLCYIKPIFCAIIVWFPIFSATQAAPTLPGRQQRWARTASTARRSWRKGRIQSSVTLCVNIKASCGNFESDFPGTLRTWSLRTRCTLPFSLWRCILQQFYKPLCIC